MSKRQKIGSKQDFKTNTQYLKWSWWQIASLEKSKAMVNLKNFDFNCYWKFHVLKTNQSIHVLANLF